MTRCVTSILLLLILCTDTMAVDLDTPAVKKVTISDEIDRGQDTLSVRCSQPIFMGSEPVSLNVKTALDYKICVDHGTEKDRLNNTDTDSFYLGYYCAAWLILNINQKVQASLQTSRSLEISRACGEAADIFF